MTVEVGATPAVGFEPGTAGHLFDQQRTAPEATGHIPGHQPPTPASDLLPWARRLSFDDSPLPADHPDGGPGEPPSPAPPTADGPAIADLAASFDVGELQQKPPGPPRPPVFPKVQVGLQTPIVNIGQFPPQPDLQYLGKARSGPVLRRLT